MIENPLLSPCVQSNPSVSRLCENALPFLSFDLIGKEHQKKIQDFSDSSPAWTTSQIGFECSLSDLQNWGDFHCLVDIQNVYQNIGFKDPSWELTEMLFNKWFHAGFLKKNEIERTILEFDIGSSQIWPPKPNICLLFKPHSTHSSQSIAQILAPLYRNNLRNREYAKEAPQFLSKLAGAVNIFLKNDWTIDGIGLMLARSDCLRVLFRTKKSINVLIEFFTDLKLVRVADLLFDVFGTFPIPPILFEIDINEDGTISPKVGIDIPPNNNQFSVGSILDKLYDRNLVSLNKKKALLSWIGRDEESNHSHSYSILRDIHHFKLICTPHQETSVKAYLSTRYIPNLQRVTTK